MNKKVRNIIFSVLLIIISVAYTIIVMKVDVKPIGPQNSLVGLATINKYFSNIIISNMLIYKITDYLGYIAIGYICIYGLIGLIQLIKRKSLKKVDVEIYLLACFYVLVLGVYFLFEKIVINYRPVLMGGLLDPSYPSSHTVLAMCFCGSSIIINNYLFKKSKLAICHNVFSIILLYAIIIGRFISGVHWFTDIVGGIIISFALLQLFKTVLYLCSKKEYKPSILKVSLVCLGFGLLCSLSIFLNYKFFNKVTIIDNIRYNEDGIPFPEVTGGVRGELGIDKNVNELTIDQYLGRSDSVYRDMRMLIDDADYEAIGGNRYLDGYVEGFEVIPLPYIIPVNNLPKEVGETYQGRTLFKLNVNGTYSANYEESMSIIEELFPKDKYIFLMCGGGGYAGMMKQFLVSMGWNANKIWVVGGYWYYTGEHDIKVPKIGEWQGYIFDTVPYHEINFYDLTKIRDDKKGLIKLSSRYYDIDYNEDYENYYTKAYEEAEKLYTNYDEQYDYANKKRAEYIDSLIENKESFVLVYHDYYDSCSAELNFYDLASEIMYKENVYFYKVDPDVYKLTSLFEDYRFIPGVLIIKDGKVKYNVDGNDNLTKKIYDADDWNYQVKLLEDWIKQFVVL